MTDYAISFFSASGAEANQNVANPVATNWEPPQWIWPLTPADGGAVSPRLGFFAEEGHADSVLLLTYSNTIFIVDNVGDKIAVGLGGDSGMFVPCKYVDNTTIYMSGFMGAGWNWDLANRVPCDSGTLFIRFIEPSDLSVQTLNSTFRSVELDANDWVASTTAGAPSGYMNVYALECSKNGEKFGDMDGANGTTGDATWTRIDSGGTSNQLSLDDHNWTKKTHDFAVCVSIMPRQTGKVINFGFMAVIEYV